MIIDPNLKKIFPNTSTLAYYSPFGQHIVYNSIEQLEYEKAIKDITNPANLTTIKTISHELRHWKDHHTTIFGVSNLVDIYNAINARLLNNPENFHYISTFIRNSKKSDLTEYYHTKVESYKIKKNGPNWKWNISIGSRFNYDGTLNHQKPIPFVRFLNPENNNLLSRTPLSVSSLLETNAIAEEIKASIDIIKKFNKTELLVEMKLMEKENLNWLYNHELTLYSAIAHLTSSITGIKDIIATFIVTSCISNLILNLPNQILQQIPINSYFKEYGEKNQLLRSENDKGYAFLNLLMNYKDKFKDKDEFEIEDLLEASSLPKKDAIEALIIDEFDSLKDLVLDGPFKNNVLTKIQNATEYFRINGLDGANKPAFDFFDYETPALIFGDTLIDESTYNYELFKKYVMKGVPLTKTGWLVMQQDIYKELEVFYNICGI